MKDTRIAAKIELHGRICFPPNDHGGLCVSYNEINQSSSSRNNGDVNLSLQFILVREK